MTLLQTAMFFVLLLAGAVFYFVFLFGLPVLALKGMCVQLKKRLSEAVLTICFLASFYTFACWYFVKSIYIENYFLPMAVVCAVSFILNAGAFKVMYKKIPLWKCAVTFLGPLVANLVMFALLLPLAMPQVTKSVRFIIENY